MKEKNCASYLDPPSSLFQALPLPIANMIGSGTTNLTQISGHPWGVEFDQSMRYPSPTVPIVAGLGKDTEILYGLPAGIPASTVIC